MRDRQEVVGSTDRERGGAGDMGPWIQGHSLSLGVGSSSNRATGKHQVRKYGSSDSNCSPRV